MAETLKVFVVPVGLLYDPKPYASSLTQAMTLTIHVSHASKPIQEKDDKAHKGKLNFSSSLLILKESLTFL